MNSDIVKRARSLSNFPHWRTYLHWSPCWWAPFLVTYYGFPLISKFGFLTMGLSILFSVLRSRWEYTKQHELFYPGVDLSMEVEKYAKMTTEDKILCLINTIVLVVGVYTCIFPGKTDPVTPPKYETTPEPEPKDELKQDLKEKLKQDLKEEPKRELKQDLKGELKQELKKEMKEELKQEMKEELKQELKEELKQELKKEIKEELKQELKEEPKQNPESQWETEHNHEPRYNLFN